MKNSISFILLAAAVFVIPGCGSKEPSVIQPQDYEMTEQEQANRDREREALAAQRQ